MICDSALMLCPEVSHAFFVQDASVTECLLCEVIRHPRVQWAAKPVSKRNGKAAFRTVDEMLRHSFVEQAAQWSLAFCERDLLGVRDPPREFEHTVVE